MLQQLAQDPDMGKAARGTPAKCQPNDGACDGGLWMRGGFRRTVAIAAPSREKALEHQGRSPYPRSLYRRLLRERANPAECWRSLVTET
jgi:hypothetical protein